MNIKYPALRILRHFIPEAVACFLLKRRRIICPGLESGDPFAAVEPYIQTLSAYGKSIQGKRVRIFGYGSCFAVGVELLRKGSMRKNFLNPTSNLNRFRLTNYRVVFEVYLQKVGVTVWNGWMMNSRTHAHASCRNFLWGMKE